MQIKRFFLSFKYACEGIYHAFKQEQNLKIHLLAACLVVIMGVFFRIQPIEWMILTLTIGGMITVELINTAIERAVDLASTNYHPLAKQAKDIAAAACLFFALTSVVIGLIIFMPKFCKLFLL